MKIIVVFFLLLSLASAQTDNLSYSSSPVFNELQFNNPGPDNYFGVSVKNAGDVNGDSFEDIIIGAAGDGPGHAYIYFGGTVMNSVPEVIINNQIINDNIGFSVSGAGDINADGYADVITGTLSGGIVYVFFGGQSMDNIPDMSFVENPGDLAFGHSVARTGDVNGDGFDDFMISAGSTNSLTGRIYIHYGGPGLDLIPDVILNGEAPNSFFGLNLNAPTGDVNCDGYDDILAGAQDFNSLNGKAYLFFGGTNMDDIPDMTFTSPGIQNQFGYNTSGGDLNGDGYSDMIITEPYFAGGGKVKIYYGGPGLDNIADVTLTGENANDNFGIYTSVASDLNNDGIADLLVGADGCNSFKGRVYIFFGGQNMDNIPDMIFNGETAGSRFGNSLSTAEDVNGDSKCDFLIGAQGYNAYSGKAYLYLSCSSQCSITGSSTVTIGTLNDYIGSIPDGYWAISNYGNTNASIISSINNDTILVDAGNIAGHYVLYYHSIDTCGEGFCNKHVYVENPLPVELTFFNFVTDQRNVTLRWSTSEEINNSGFEIERKLLSDQYSVISDHWIKVGSVIGNGNTFSASVYEFSDRFLESGRYKYRLKQIDYNGNFEYYDLINDVVIGTPEKFFLSQNYPNPFNPATKINFNLVNPGIIKLKIFDNTGKQVALLVNEYMQAGYYTVEFNGSGFASGIYFYELRTENFSDRKKMILLK